MIHLVHEESVTATVPDIPDSVGGLSEIECLVDGSLACLYVTCMVFTLQPVGIDPHILVLYAEEKI